MDSKIQLLAPIRIVAVIFFSVVILVYAHSLSGPFIWDDKPLVVDNPLIKNWANFAQVFKSEVYLDTSTNYFRPLETMTFMADYALFKLSPFGYHLTNVLFHFLAGIFLFWVLTLITKNFFLSFATGLTFLVHPIHSEAVSYISGRADPLAAVFILSSLGCYIKACSTDRFKGYSHTGLVLLSLVLFIFALLSKEIAVIFPLAVLGLDTLMMNDKKRILRVLPFFIIVLFYGFLRMSVLNFSSGNALLSKKGFAVLDVGLIFRLGIFLKTFVIYLGSLFIPFNLHMERIVSFEKITFFHWAGVAFCLGLYVLLRLRTDTKLKEKIGLLHFSLYWFLIWILPQSALVFPRLMADHFLYLPSIGIFLIVALNIDALKSLKIRNLFLIFLSAYFGVFTVIYNHQWRDELSFFVRTTKLSPASFRAHDNLAAIYLKENRIEEAVREYQLILDPDGSILDKKDFVLFVHKVLKRPIAQERRKLASIAFYNLGVIFADQGRQEDAIRAYEAALKVNPRSKMVYNNLALVYERKGMFPEAEALYQKAIALDGHYVQAYNNLGQLHAKRGDFKRAIALWRKALEIKPDYEIAKKNISLAQKPIKND